MKNRILVIEDDLLNLDLVTDLLEASHFVVYRARTAEEGLSMAWETFPSLILMDISLPGMDGLAATKALKSSPATCHLPVIALTAHAMKGDEDATRTAGCDGYLTKPIDTRAFVDTVTRFVASSYSRLTEKKKTLKTL